MGLDRLYAEIIPDLKLTRYEFIKGNLSYDAFIKISDGLESEMTGMVHLHCNATYDIFDVELSRMIYKSIYGI